MVTVTMFCFRINPGCVQLSPSNSESSFNSMDDFTPTHNHISNHGNDHDDSDTGMVSTSHTNQS